ncbi:30S ribosomal protein S9 [bacterium]|nr:30S ribosomal protein S9 [bacterium]
MLKQIEYKGLGRRKTSIAKVLMVPGKGKVLVNDKPLKDYFPNDLIIQEIMQPFQVTNTMNSFDVKAKVFGGGFTGQAGAMRLGIARALITTNNDFKLILKKEKLLTRDPRAKERKKYGKYGARRSPQFTKR